MSSIPISTVPLPSWPVIPPQGIAEIKRAFGNITIANGQIATKGWESANMVLISDFPGVKKLYVNKAVVEPLRWCLQCSVQYGKYPIRTIGCFAPRVKSTNAGALSTHSWGIAVDINASTNPLAPFVGAPMLSDMPLEWVAIWEAAGWVWGGRWKRADAMHFQWAIDY